MMNVIMQSSAQKAHNADTNVILDEQDKSTTLNGGSHEFLPQNNPEEVLEPTL